MKVPPEQPTQSSKRAPMAINPSRPLIPRQICFSSDDIYLAVMVIHGFRHRLPLVPPNLRYKFPFRQDDPAVPIFKRLSRLPVLEDDFYLLDNPFVADLFLIDPLDDGSKQVVFVAIQRLDFTDDHFDLLL